MPCRRNPLLAPGGRIVFAEPLSLAMKPTRMACSICLRKNVGKTKNSVALQGRVVSKMDMPRRRQRGLFWGADLSIPVGDDPARGFNRRKLEAPGEVHIAH
jgi:hypothetical protein